MASTDISFKITAQANDAIAQINKVSASFNDIDQTYKNSFDSSKLSAVIDKFGDLDKTSARVSTNLKTGLKLNTNDSLKSLGEVGDKIDRVGSGALRMVNSLGVGGEEFQKFGGAIADVGDLVDRTLSQGFNPLAIGITAVTIAVPLLINAFTDQKRSMEELKNSIEQVNADLKITKDINKEIAMSDFLTKTFNKDIEALKSLQKTLNSFNKVEAKEFASTFSSKDLGATARNALSSIEKDINKINIEMKSIEERKSIGDIVIGGNNINEMANTFASNLANINTAVFIVDENTKKWIKNVRDTGELVSAERYLFAVLGKSGVDALNNIAEKNETVNNALKNLKNRINEGIIGVETFQKVSEKKLEIKDNTQELLNNKIEYYKSIDNYDKLTSNNIIDREEFRAAVIKKKIEETRQILNMPVNSIKINNNANDANYGNIELQKGFQKSEENMTAIQIANQDLRLQLTEDYGNKYLEAMQMIFDVPKGEAQIQMDMWDELAIKLENYAEKFAEAHNEMSIASNATSTIINGSATVMSDAFIAIGSGAKISAKEIANALKNQLANTLKAISQEAAVRAIFESAMGLASLFINPAAASAHFLSAATFGVVAGMSGVAAGVMGAKGQFNSNGGASSNSANSATSAADIALQALEDAKTTKNESKGATVYTTYVINGDANQTALDKTIEQQERLYSQIIQVA